MKYNMLGNTGLQVSVYGLGGHEYQWTQAGNLKEGRFSAFNPERIEIVKCAVEKGVNYFDTTFPEEVQSLGHCTSILGCRKDMIINGMIIDVVQRVHNMSSKEMCKFVASELNMRLELLKSDYFDVFMLCAIDHGFDMEIILELLHLYQKQQNDGKIMYIGISCHDHDLLYRFMTEQNPCLDVVMFPYNYAVAYNYGDQYSVVPKLIRHLKEKGIGIVAMKPLIWYCYGIPFTAWGNIHEEMNYSIQNSICWQMMNAEADTSVIGINSMDEFERNLSAINMQHFDEGLLDEHLHYGRRFDNLIQNAAKYDTYIQNCIIERAKSFINQDFGYDLQKYLDYWKIEMKKEAFPFAKIK